MEQKISTTDELHMTRAIEKAATLADVNEELDRNKLIAEQLQKEHVDKRFAKTAAAAFNKRLTVLKLQKTADEHKAAPFPLCDPELVYQMLGGDPEISKTASVGLGAFSAFYTENKMSKAAAANPSRERIEDHMTPDKFMDNMSLMLDKAAAALEDARSDEHSAQLAFDRSKAKLSSMLDKTAGFSLFTLGRLYGQELADALGNGMTFEKKACVRPKGAMYDAADELLKNAAALKDARAALTDVEDAVDDLTKLASAYSYYVSTMQANGINLTKEAAIEADTKQLVMDTAIGAPIAIGSEAMNFGMNAINNSYQLASQTWNNAMQKYYAGRDIDVSPGRVLDAQFINNDRFHDRMLAWSDMTADKAFAQYPSKELFRAVNKAMNADLSLERPDRREVLRGVVDQLLLQNNRLSNADISALGQTLKSYAEAGPGLAQETASKVKELDKVTAPAQVEYNPVDLKADYELTDFTKDLAKDLDTQISNIYKRRAEEDKAQKAENKAKEKQAKDLAMLMLQEQYGGKVTVDSNGQLLGNGTPIDASTLNAVSANAVQLLEEHGEKISDIFSNSLKDKISEESKEKQYAQKAHTMAIEKYKAEHPDETIDSYDATSNTLTLAGGGTVNLTSDYDKAYQSIQQLGIGDAAGIASADNRRTEANHQRDIQNDQAALALAVRSRISGIPEATAYEFNSSGDLVPIDKNNVRLAPIPAADIAADVTKYKAVFDQLGVAGTQSAVNDVIKNNETARQQARKDKEADDAVRAQAAETAKAKSEYIYSVGRQVAEKAGWKYDPVQNKWLKPQQGNPGVFSYAKPIEIKQLGAAAIRTHAARGFRG